MATPEATLAHLAVEYWKLLKTMERTIEAIPHGSRDRFVSQARYSASRLVALLAEQNMSLQDFDGMDFEVNLPASPVNGDDFPNNGEAVVERTLEPAVIANMLVVSMGKVFLAKKG